jgi:isoaspartyl peptidase/L-asparaginase-like protein (Ntn-hydrolase superfamily)
VATRTRPVIVSSANGHRYKNGGPNTCVEKAFAMMTQGSDVLDALMAGVNIVELDPLDTSVGYGGLPNAEGVVQLDASCMHGPSAARRGGELEGADAGGGSARRPAQTDHHLLVGAGAQASRGRSGCDRARPQHRELAEVAEGSGSSTRALARPAEAQQAATELWRWSPPVGSMPNTCGGRST